MAGVILTIMTKLMIYSPLQFFTQASQIWIFANFLNFFRKISEYHEFHGGFHVRAFFVFEDYRITFNILRVFRPETWLTVYRALYILKHSVGAKGCLGQRLSILWPRETL